MKDWENVLNPRDNIIQTHLQAIQPYLCIHRDTVEDLYTQDSPVMSYRRTHLAIEMFLNETETRQDARGIRGGISTPIAPAKQGIGVLNIFPRLIHVT